MSDTNQVLIDALRKLEQRLFNDDEQVITALRNSVSVQNTLRLITLARIAIENQPLREALVVAEALEEERSKFAVVLNAEVLDAVLPDIRDLEISRMRNVLMLIDKDITGSISHHPTCATIANHGGYHCSCDNIRVVRKIKETIKDVLDGLGEQP